MPRTEPTEDQLEEAWQQLRRPEWPGTLGDLKLAAARYGLVRLHALLLAEGKRPAAAPPPAPEQLLPNVGRYERRRDPRLHVPRHPASLDRKRLAAGERDED